jgi:hypothetical protein
LSSGATHVAAPLAAFVTREQWRADCCIHASSGAPAGHLPRLVALLLSCARASVAEFRRQTLAPDDKQASRVTPPSLLQFAQSSTLQRGGLCAWFSSQAGASRASCESTASGRREPSDRGAAPRDKRSGTTDALDVLRPWPRRQRSLRRGRGQARRADAVGRPARSVEAFVQHRSRLCRGLGASSTVCPSLDRTRFVREGKA